MERLKNMGLKKSFLLLSLSCLAVAFLLLGAVIFLCRGIENHYPLGGVEILSDGSVVPLPSPTVSQQRILAILNIVQTVSCILFPVGGLIVSVFLFYYLKLKQPISCLQNGIMRIQNNDLDFSLPILSNDEMGQLCAAFEEMRSELLKSNRLLWQQAEERKRLNAAFSHDLRNPITVLKGSVKLLRQGIQDEQTIDRLESYTLRIEQYVEAMSSVQKLEQLSVKPKEIRLSVLQSELQETARLLALSKKVSVLVPSGGTVCIDHGLFLTVAGFDGIVPTMMEKLPSLLFGLVIVLVLSASMSTLSSLVLTSSSTLTIDLIKPIMKEKMDEKKQLITMRIFIAVFLIISVVLAIITLKNPQTVISTLMSISWGALAGAFLAPFMYGLFWKGVTKAACMASFIAGVGITVVHMAYYTLAGHTGTLWGINLASPINAGAFAMLFGLVLVPIVSLITRQSDADKAHAEKVFECYNDSEI